MTRAALVGLVLAGAAACSRQHKTPAEATRDAAVALPLAPLTAPVTTDPAIALHNLDARVTDGRERVARGEQDAAFKLVAVLLQRARFEGRVADLVTADEMSARLVVERGGDARSHMARAGALSAIHAFVPASAELDAAARLGASREDVASERAAILLAVGRPDEAAAKLDIPDDSVPQALMFKAAIESRLGHAAEAERLFEKSRSEFRDTSPFFVASSDFERATALERVGDRARARQYLEEAAAVLPTFSHAVTHLATYEPAAIALERLRALEATSDDPDVLGAEAEALRMLGREDESQAVAGRAAARYAEVLARLPTAYADHAASFFLGVGRNPERALELARANADNRPTDEAIELWLTAAQAAASLRETCAAAAKARGLARAPGGLRERAVAAARLCP